MKRSWLAALVVSIGVYAPAVAEAQTAAEVVAGVEKFYANTKQVTTRFDQLFTNTTFGTKEPSAGTVQVERPGKMHWQYDAKRKGAKPRKTFIADGKDVYYIDHVNKSVTKHALATHAMPAAVAWLHGNGTLSKDFTAALSTSGSLGSGTQVVVDLTPKQPSAAYKTLTLVVDPADYHVVKVAITDSSDNVNEFDFIDPDFKTAIAATRFKLNRKALKGYKLPKP